MTNKHRWIWAGSLLLTLFLAADLVGQTVETTETVERSDSLFGLLWKGGIVMIPLAACSLITMTLAMERFISLGKKVVIPEDFESEIQEILNGQAMDRNEVALEKCAENKSPLARMYEVAIQNWELLATDVDKIIGDQASLALRKFRRSIRPLRLIGGIAPLLGLLGTVFGMIRSFQTVALSSQSINKAELLAEGIYQAMVTTAAGLSIAIPTLIIYFYFNNRIDKIGESLEEKGNEFVQAHFRERFKLQG